MNVYIAAPLFSESERLLNASICAAMESLCTIHLPQRDGPIVEQAIAGGMPVKEAMHAAFVSDIRAIKKCDVLVAVLDGRAMDEGVCVEVGFAKAIGKQIVGLKTDARRTLPWGNNPMIDGCIDVWVSSVEELSKYIRAAQATML